MQKMCEAAAIRQSEKVATLSMRTSKRSGGGVGGTLRDELKCEQAVRM